MLYRFTLFLLVIVGAVGCDKSGAEPGPTNSVTVSYAQTSCADPWQHTAPNTAAGFQQAAEQYVQQLGIRLYKVRVTGNTNQAMCLGCHCTTGRHLEAEAAEKDVDALLQLGFRRK